LDRGVAPRVQRLLPELGELLQALFDRVYRECWFLDGHRGRGYRDATRPRPYGGAVSEWSVVAADLERLRRGLLDLHLARLRLLGDGDGDCEHPGVVGGLEPVGVEGLAEHD